MKKNASSWPFGLIPPGYAKVILADPPWSFKTYSAKGLIKSPDAHYNCMGLADIKALPVGDLAAKDCALILWATFPMLPEALATMAAWGFTYKTGGAWLKLSKTGTKPAFGTGYLLRSASELFLIGARGKPCLRDSSAARSIRNLVVDAGDNLQHFVGAEIVAPVREHSRKPDQMHQMATTLWDGPYIELFARQRRPGWIVWGNQIQLFNEGCS